MSHPLSHSDLFRIIEEYLTSDLTKYATEKKYGLYQGCITYWLHTFGLDDKPKNEDIMVEQPTTSTPRRPFRPAKRTNSRPYAGRIASSKPNSSVRNGDTKPTSS